MLERRRLGHRYRSAGRCSDGGAAVARRRAAVDDFRLEHGQRALRRIGGPRAALRTLADAPADVAVPVLIARLEQATADAGAFRPGFTGLRCRNCDTPQETAPVFVCPRCFGPLEATYDLDSLRSRLERATLDARPASIWRYAELLPVESIPTEGLRVGLSPLVPTPRLAAALGL